jgi:S-adenosylmethionine hydrolase
LAGKIQGSVVSVSSSGDLVTDIAAEQLDGAPRDESVTIACGGHHTSCIFPADHGEPEMTFLALLNDSGQLQLSLVGESASAFLGIKPGDEVTVRW